MLILGGAALKLTRKHAPCTKGVRTRDHDFFTSKILMIPRKSPFWFIVKMSQQPLDQSSQVLEHNPNST
jgi:hypothetical protein